MIVFIAAEQEARAFPLAAGRTVIHIFQQQVTLLSREREVMILPKQGLRCQPAGKITHGTKISLTDSLTGAVCQIYFSIYHQKFNEYRKYQLQGKCLSIGSDLTDEIYVQDHNLQAHHFQLYPNSQRISNLIGDGLGYLNQKKLSSRCWHAGDRFQCLNLCIIFHADFLMINSCENLFVSLPLYQDNKTVRRLPDVNADIIRYQRQVCLPKPMVIELEEPDKLPELTAAPMIFTMGPALMMTAASFLSSSFTVYQGYQAGREIVELLPALILPAVMFISILFWNPLQRAVEIRACRRRAGIRKENYLMYLASVRRDLSARNTVWRIEAMTLFPAEEELLQAIQSKRIWQKMPEQQDWLMIRIGTGRTATDMNLKKSFKLKHDDPLFLPVRQAEKSCQAADRMPLLISLWQYRHIVFEGDQAVKSYFFFVLLQIFSFFGFDSLKIAVLASEEWIHDNAWIQLIPHLYDERTGLRMIAVSVRDMQFLNHSIELNQDRAVIVIALNIDLIGFLARPQEMIILQLSHAVGWHHDHCDMIIRWQQGKGKMITDSQQTDFVTEDLTVFDPERIFEQMVHFTLPNSSLTAEPAAVTFFDLYGISKAAQIRISERWNRNLARDAITAFVGMRRDHTLITLDLQEKAQGPHGLIAGTTGSGKSEWIITMLLSLAVNYSPREVQFALIDFKGGGAVAAFANRQWKFPHIAGTLSNLDIDEMERALVSFSNECSWRETQLNKMSDLLGLPIMSLDVYQKQWKAEFSLPYIPHLIMVVDEFAELKKERPEFMTDLISIARIGRSLGLHLILSTQKPGGIVNDQIWSNSRFKVCLKVQERQDSIDMIHQPDAAAIHRCGQFYLLSDEVLENGQGGYSNASSGQAAKSVQLLDLMGRTVKEKHSDVNEEQSQLAGVTQEILQAARQEAIQIRKLWLEPLPKLSWSDFEAKDRIILGRIDDFYHRSQPILCFDEKRMIHMGVFSPSHSEKTKLIRTVLYSLIRKTSIEDEIYFLDDIGLNCPELIRCPQIIDVIDCSQTEKMRNMLHHLRSRTGREKNTCYLLAANYASVNEGDEEIRTDFQQLLEEGGRKHVSLILFFNLSSDISCRNLAWIPFRLLLKCENQQEIMNLFEMSQKKGQKKDGFGLMKTDHLLEFRTIETDIFELRQLIETVCRKNGTKKRYQIPCMPEQIRICEYTGPGFGLGRRIDDYEWSILPTDGHLIMLATYEEELTKYAAAWLAVHPHAVLHPTRQQGEDLLMMPGGWLAIMTLKEYENSDLHQAAASGILLFIGLGFRDQFLFSKPGRKELRANQAVMICQGNSEVIQLAE